MLSHPRMGCTGIIPPALSFVDRCNSFAKFHTKTQTLKIWQHDDPTFSPTMLYMPVWEWQHSPECYKRITPKPRISVCRFIHRGR